MDFDCSHEIRRLNKTLVPLKESHDKPRQCVKKQRHPFTDKDPSSQSYVFSSRQAWMWELDHKEGWVPKKWCFWIVVLEKTLQSPLDSTENKPVNPKGNPTLNMHQKDWCWSWSSNIWPPDAKNWLMEKTLTLRKIEGRRRGQQRMRWLEGIISSIDLSLSKLQTLGDSEGQGSLARCSPRGCKESDTT